MSSNRIACCLAVGFALVGMGRTTVFAQTADPQRDQILRLLKVDQLEETLKAQIAELVARPDSSPTPEWMQGVRDSIERTERNRARLRMLIGVDFKQVPLKDALEFISDQTGMHFVIQYAELDLLGVDSEVPVNLTVPSGSVEKILALLLDTFELTFQTTELGILVTSKDAASSELEIRYFDSAWVLPSPDRDSNALMATIQNCIQPDSWLQNGGTSSIQSIGSVLIVSAPQTTQRQIESLFGNLSRFNSAAANHANHAHSDEPHDHSHEHLEAHEHAPSEAK